MRISLSDILRFIFKPYGIVTLTGLSSFIAWLLPDFDFLWKGYDSPQSLLSFGGLVVLVWYTLIILISWLMFRLGQLSDGFIKSFDDKARLDDFPAYCFLSFIAFIGFVFTAQFIITSLGLSKTLAIIISGNANILHKTLYEDYSIGLFSLRYAVILSGGLAIFRIVARISRSLLDIANIIMLLLLAVIASRLSVVFALMIGFGLWTVNSEKIKLKIWRWIIFIFVIFVIFSLYNYSRNINFYLTQGNSGFFTAGISEIVKYLASPFQGALAAGNNMERIIAAPENVYMFTGINPSLTTNSALLGLVVAYGYSFIPIMTLTAVLSSFLMGLTFRQRRNYLILVYFVLLYCFAEIWRVYIFNAGIITTLLILSLIAPFASQAIKSSINFFKTTPQKSKKEINRA